MNYSFSLSLIHLSEKNKTIQNEKLENICAATVILCKEFNHGNNLFISLENFKAECRLTVEIDPKSFTHRVCLHVY